MVMTMMMTMRFLVWSEQQPEGLRAKQQRQAEADHMWLRSQTHNNSSSNDDNVA